MTIKSTEHQESTNPPLLIASVSGLVFLNKHNLKSLDKYRTKSFLGDIIITSVYESYFKVKMEHVSGENYYATCTFHDFNNKMLTSEITSLVRS